MRERVKRERDRSPSVEDAMKLQTRERERLPIAEEGRRREKERERETGSEQKTRVLDVNLVERGERSPTVEDDRTMKKFKILDCEGAKEDMETEGNKGENDAASCDSQDQMLVETDSSVPAINVEKQSAATTPHKGIDASLNHGETVWNPDRLQGQLDVESSQNGIARATRAVMAEARSQQAASMTEFHWLGHRFPISNAKTRAPILKAQELEKDIHGPSADSIPADKRLATFDKIFSAYREARGYIRADLSTAGSAENVKDELYGVDKAVSSALGERTIERNLLLVKVAKSKLADENNEKVTKPEELVRLYDLLLQNTADLAGLVSTGRDKKPEEVSCAEDCASKTLAFRAERCFYVAKSYSMAEKRAEAYALYCRARDLAEDALRKLKTLNGNNQTMVKDLEGLCNECRSNSCIEHVSNMSWTVDEQLEKFLTEKLGVCASAVDVKRVAL